VKTKYVIKICNACCIKSADGSVICLDEVAILKTEQYSCRLLGQLAASQPRQHLRHHVK
jgi:hypothetical protein